MLSFLMKVLFAFVVYLPILLINVSLDYLLTNGMYDFRIMIVVILSTFVIWRLIGKLYDKMISLLDDKEDEVLVDFEEVKTIEAVEDYFHLLWFILMMASIFIGASGHLSFNVFLFAILCMYGHIDFLLKMVCYKEYKVQIGKFVYRVYTKKRYKDMCEGLVVAHRFGDEELII